jgi:hypothetical protein
MVIHQWQKRSTIRRKYCTQLNTTFVVDYTQYILITGILYINYSFTYSKYVTFFSLSRNECQKI